MRDALESVGTFFLIVAVIIGGALVKIWAVMLLVGALHSMNDGIPALGFDASAILTLIIAVAAWAPSRSKD
ncbi:hypothetical protein SEA_ARACELI_40 [Streptomyces phage Araceli]|nr:hypothetical protein SEA_HENOCCUS_40 [Streptomyces phage Henoccus]AWY07358.1 hypothetical protein SEA_JACKIEB_40 [Streptomyces phage JackieB]QFG07854.1 hypothetical protein SEA_ARACELI_40 [Streptomyces phage Araceli]